MGATLNLDFKQKLIARAIIQQFAISRPCDSYTPHQEGQIQFHKAPHTIRGLFPGNGFGKTTAVAAECHNWCIHSNRWQKTPDHPVQIVWFCQDYQQFGKLRDQIERDVIGNTAKWRETTDGKFYEYPDGSRWFVSSADRSWTFFQGTNPDLIAFDEQPPVKLWREAMMRRRGKRKTKYVVSATATQGLSWMADVIWAPWKECYEELGISHDAALTEQPHRDIWVWDEGGIEDNPGADEEDVRWYKSQTWSSEKEKKVRLRGGFEDWTGDSVFDASAIERMREILNRWKSQNPDYPLEGILEPIFPPTRRTK